MKIQIPMSFTSKQPQKSEAETPEHAPKRSPRPTDQKAFEHRDEWANSPGLQPPK